jgi:hypothetical protein
MEKGKIKDWQDKKKDFDGLIAYFLWNIWNERNRRTFHLSAIIKATFTRSLSD